MTELTATVQTLTPDALLVVPRDLTSPEHADLERLRAPLAGGVDRTDSRALAWFWDRVVPTQPGSPAPAGLVEWVGVALGDLLVTHVPGSHWVVCPGPAGPTLGVSGAAHPLSPVVPLPDAQDRWAAGATGWINGYLDAAAAHLAGTTLPQPRPSSENVAVTEVQAAAASQDDEPGTDDEPGAASEDEWAPTVAPGAGTSLPSRGSAQPPVAEDEPGSTSTSAPAPAPERPANLPHPPSTTAQDLALRALQHALVVLRRGPFDREAFVMLVDDSGTRTLACTGEPAEALRQARDTARASGARAAAIGWIDRRADGIPDPRQGFPAVLVEASEAGAPGLRVAHRFVEDALGTGPLGDPVLVGEVAALL